MQIAKFLNNVVRAVAWMPLCLALTANAAPGGPVPREKKTVTKIPAPAAVKVAAAGDNASARAADAMLDAKAMPSDDAERYRNAIQVVANPACTARSPCMLA